MTVPQVPEPLTTKAIADWIDDPKKHRRDVAALYAVALRMGPFVDVNFSAVNHAIVERWSLSGLKWIKALAWKAVTESEAY